MKRLIPFLSVTLVLVLASVNAHAQRSDYQVKTEFETKYTSLKSSVNSAMSVNEVDSLMNTIDSLEYNYEEHEEMLDHALYPDSFGSRIAELRDEARTAEHRLLIIENQQEKLGSLTTEADKYRREISTLNSRADSLQNAIAASQESEKRLSDLVQRYRESLERRDEFILRVMDSVLIAYKDLSPESVKELAEGAESGRLSRDNPLEVISTIVDENIRILKNNREALNTEDYLRMYAVQKRFNEVWNQVGDDLVTIYGGSEKAKWKNSMDKKLQDWRASASKNMWASLDTYLEQNKLELGAFDNNQSFYIALDNFVKNARKTSKEQMITSENYEHFKKFNSFWSSKIKQDWNKFVHEGEVLTMSQIASIDNEMTTWRDEAKPKSFLFPILFGISILAVIALVVVVVKQRD